MLCCGVCRIGGDVVVGCVIRDVGLFVVCVCCVGFFSWFGLCLLWGGCVIVVVVRLVM